METKRFAVIGSSHLISLIKQYGGHLHDSEEYQPVWSAANKPAVRELPLGIEGWKGNFILYNTMTSGPPPTLQGNTLFIPPQLTAVLDHIPKETQVVFSLMRGHEFAVNALVDNPSHADFMDEDGGFEQGRRWMSREDAQAWVHEIAHPLLTTNLALQLHLPQARIVHFAAPPPVEDEAHILSNPEGFGPLFERYGIKPFPMRLRLYRLMYAELERQLAQYGILSYPPPEDALTPAGGLKAEFAFGCLHGNPLYAQGLAAQIREVLTHVPPL